MKSDFRITKIKTNEIERLYEKIADALVIPPHNRKGVLKEFKEIGVQNARAIRIGSEIIGGLIFGQWGHFFGGKSVPAAGVAFVGVASEYRRLGAAKMLMTETVREFYKMGIPISTLFPANIPLYRTAGYECAITRIRYKLNLNTVRLRNMSCDMVPYDGKSRKVFTDIYRAFMMKTNGNIDRSHIFWKLILDPWWWDGTVAKYLIKKGKEIQGYAIFFLKSEKDPLIIRDYCVLNHDAALRLLTFIADHSSQLKIAKWFGGPNDILAQVVPDRSAEYDYPGNCMLRIVSVPGALESRGYTKILDTELNLEIYDDVVPENNGKFVLKIENGKGSVKKGGSGKMKMDIRALAQMYTGYMSAHELRLASGIEATDSDCEIADLIFSGPSPWIRDEF